jgi:hypothetical protein
MRRKRKPHNTGIIVATAVTLLLSVSLPVNALKTDQDQTINVGRHQTVTVGANRSLNVGISENIPIGASQNVTVGADRGKPDNNRRQGQEAGNRPKSNGIYGQKLSPQSGK